MTSRTRDRGLVVVIATALLAVLVAQVAIAGGASPGPLAAASGNLRQQLRNLKQRVARLEQSEKADTNHPTGPAGGSLTGTYPNPSIAPNAVTSADIANSAIQNDQLAANAVEPQNISAVPTARIRRIADQSISNNTSTAIAYNTSTNETWDPLDMHVSGDNFFTAPIQGVYLLTGSVLFASGSSGEGEVAIEVNGNKPVAAAAQALSTTVDNFVTVSTAYRLVGGDQVRLKVLQTSGGSLNVVASSSGTETSPEFSMTWIGPA